MVTENLKRAKLRTFLNRKRRTRRLVEKNGDLRVINIGMEEKSLLFLKDGWTTLVDLRWRYLALIFFASFLLSWFMFALVWHIMFWLHGDLEEGGIICRKNLILSMLLYLLLQDFDFLT